MGVTVDEIYLGFRSLSNNEMIGNQFCNMTAAGHHVTRTFLAAQKLWKVATSFSRRWSGL